MQVLKMLYEYSAETQDAEVMIDGSEISNRLKITVVDGYLMGGCHTFTRRLDPWLGL